MEINKLIPRNKKNLDSINYKIKSLNKEQKILELNKIKVISNRYKYIFSLFLINALLITNYFFYNKYYDIAIYQNYIKDCNNLKRYNLNINNKNNKYYYISICLPVYNMEKYIEKSLLSIINQSFQNFEIIIINDNSKDNTIDIIRKIQLENNRIKIINHYINLGVYKSRIDAALNAKGEYILYVDPDDMIINPYLFEKLFNYNSQYNLDIIEFTVYHQKEGYNKFYLPEFHEFNHYHKFKDKIISQPELSNIIFYIPNTKNFSSVFCRTIWNKIIKKNILLKTIEYIHKFFSDQYLITADDTSINIVNFHYANNYSNINLPGYLYKIRKNSMSRIDNGREHDINVSYNYLLYFKLFYNYIKDFNKNINFLLYDLKISYFYILKLKDLNATTFVLEAINFYKELNNNNLSEEFQILINDSIHYLIK